ncbi:hypothetical protein [Psychrobacter sp. LV10R520-6]|uniref:hypothetical protein n=1 Tax=Psychrobacter sp. LV10R520-6 TaxID=1415574 RepID=UPI0024C5CA52|nr:hypothetical protein [Psychrobacter sp. LV10R520-6]SNT71377.1 hypothetical protein SAMN04488491_2616 [Psychrobacter sp. LV10R520-6]
MTQPTFEPTNPTAKPSGQQGHSASAVDKSDFEKNQLSPKNKHDDQQLNRLPMMPDKAALLALFTLPSLEKRSSEMALIEQPSTNNPSAQTSANPQLPANPPLSANKSLDTDTSETNVATQRVALYRAQHQRTRLLYLASANTRPTYLVQTLKTQFVEYQHYLLAQQLDKRGLLDTEPLERLWQQLHVVDDIIADIVSHMPAQQPAGWQLTTQDGHNPLRFPTIGKLKHPKPIQDQASLNSYVLGHFGVSSFTYDRGYYIGHVVGYLFSCYFCAHLSISYGVTALGEQVVGDYDYASLETPHMVRLLQGLDGYCKKRIYQLAVICARLSVYASDKRIEKMLIAEVNDFDKKLQQQHLDVLLLQGMMPDSSDSTPLF